MLEKTLPQLLKERAEKSGNHAVMLAMRQKKLGIWNEITWSSYYEQVKQLAVGFVQLLHFKRGDKLAIIGENKPEWVFAELAAQSVGGIAVGIFQESSYNELLFMLNHCDARLVIVEDQEIVDRLLTVEEQIPNIEKIIYYNDNGMRKYKHSKLMNMQEIMSYGEKYDQQHPDFFNAELSKGNADDVAIINYSNGTTGEFKSVLLSHQNLISVANNMAAIDPVKDTDDTLSFIPLPLIGEQVMSITMSICQGITLNFPEKTSTVAGDLREIGPHVIFAPPRLYENIVSKFKLRIQDSSWFKKKVYNFFKPYGEKMAEAKLHNKPATFVTKLMYTLGDFLVFSAIRDHLGLARIKRAYVGGASLGKEVYEFFHGLGVNLKQTYGSTEFSGIAYTQRDGDIAPHSVGEPLPNTEVKISEEGEIFIKSLGAFKGYYKNEALTRKVLENGWIQTGDSGYIGDDGHLYVIDRMEDVICTKTGEKISPSQIENKLTFSSYIREAVIVGKDRPFLVAMFNIDFENVGRWAEKNQLVYTTYSDLAQLPEVISLIEKEVSEIMKDIPVHSRVKKFILLHKELNTADEEVTRLRKVRKNYVINKYRCLIEAMYGTEAEICVRQIDGFEAEQQTRLRVIFLDQEKEVA